MPARLFGSGIPAPGAVADARAAERHARELVARHHALVAPDVDISDLELVSNDLDAGLRTVAFAQTARVGAERVRVSGAFVSLRFKADRMIALASSIFPSARVGAAAAVPSDEAAAAALAWALETHGRARVEAPLVLELLPSHRGRPTVAWRVRVEASEPASRYDTWIDAETGRRLEREQLLRFAQGTVRFDAPVRAPQAERKAYPAALLSLRVDGAAAQTDALGVVTWPGPAPALLDLGAGGSLVQVESQTGENAKAMLALSDMGEVTWSLASDEKGDAQLSAFVHAGIALERIRAIAPELSFGSELVKIRVNGDEKKYVCNAYWDGSSANFYVQWNVCNNTARLADVVYHELGHGLHQHAIIPGTGAWDASLSEGGGDYFAATITGDPTIAPGFFVDGGLLREIDSDRRWPEDISGDPHETGLIFAGALWDLRTALARDLGDADGIALADWLYFQALRRADDIPSSYVEILVADDDDGDLSNGTPHVCAINEAFVTHGLTGAVNGAGLQATHAALDVIPPGKPAHVEVETSVLYPQCTGDALEGVYLQWRPRGYGAWESVALEPQGETWSGELPPQEAGYAFEYQIVLRAGSSELVLPENPADDRYRAFAGELRTLYETDFEDGGVGWTPGSEKGLTDFEVGPPGGEGGDPASAFSGATVLGNQLDGSGEYRSKRSVFVDGPIVDLVDERFVRLQFRRWLTVEDGYFDQASVYVNGLRIWQNEGTDETNGALDHVDREWRFEDIDLAPFVKSGDTTVQVRFELVSDAYYELGGWTIDDVRIVAHDPPPSPADGSGTGGSATAPVVLTSDDVVAGGGGCGCSTVRQRPGLGWVAAALALATIAWRRRRSGTQIDRP